jgi:hypothetical protein
MKFASVLAAAAMTFLSAIFASASATPISGPVTINYNMTLQPGISGVFNMMVIERWGSGPLSYDYLSASGSSLALGPGQTSFSLALTTPTPQHPLLDTLAIGWTTGGHLVVLGNFAPSQIGLSYSALFPNAIEEIEILTDLQSIFNPNAPYNPDLIFDAWTVDEEPFAQEAAALGLFTPLGSPVDAVSFSDGQLIGTGTVTAVPEPLTLSLFGFGVAGAIAARRRKSKS